jgi:ribose/xylose/arabinose/galactoside ABC-type transport system permease subunit
VTINTSDGLQPNAGGASEVGDSYSSAGVGGRLAVVGALLGRHGFVAALMLPAVFLLIFDDRFRGLQNLSNVLAQSSIVGIAAIGMTVVMIIGGFDLSVGATAAFAGLVAVLGFGQGGAAHMALGVFAAIASGIGIGFINGVIISRLSVNPLIATLAMASIVRGIVLIASEGTIYRAEGDAASITTLALGRWHLFPIAGIFFIAAVIVGWFLLSKMRFGHYVYAIGGNESAAKLAGVPVARMIVSTYAIVGGFAGLAGLLLLARTGSALTNAGVGLELEAITAAVIGGTRLGGGAGSISGTVLGVLLLGVIRNGLNLNGVSPFWQPFIIGCILLTTVVLSRRGEGAHKRSTSGLW